MNFFTILFRSLTLFLSFSLPRSLSICLSRVVYKSKFEFHIPIK